VNRGVADPERAAPGATNTTPQNQAATNQDQVWPHCVIRRGDAVRPLPPHARSLEDLTLRLVASASASATTWPAAEPRGSWSSRARSRWSATAWAAARAPSDELLDREVDHRDARRRRAPRWRDQQPGRSLRPLPAAAARLGL